MAPEDRYRIEHLADAESVSEADVLEFWERERAMPADSARDRVREVSLVATEPEDGLVAVSTVFLARSERLGMELWQYRTFVAERHRRGFVAQQLFRQTVRELEERFVSGADVRGAGILIRVESEILRRVKNEAIWPNTRFAFIGEDANGNHLRVRYFPGAVVPLPA